MRVPAEIRQYRPQLKISLTRQRRLLKKKPLQTKQREEKGRLSAQRMMRSDSKDCIVVRVGQNQAASNQRRQRAASAGQ